MVKGKLKEEKKYLSVILVPHISEKEKVLKFSTLYSRVKIILSLAAAFLICSCFFTVYTFVQNNKLKRDNSTLTNMNIEQKNLLNEKSEELNSLKEQKDTVDKKMDDFLLKYREMTDKYITNKTNRSGSSTDRAFVTDINELKVLLNNIINEEQAAGNNTAVISDTENKLKKYMDTIPTLWPASGRISSYFGSRTDPLHFGKGIHEGIDIAANYGQPIKASASGTVTFSGYRSGYGYSVCIDHGHGISTVYAHASQLIAKKGHKVNKGDLIARVGNSGRSTGSHLHFEVRINGTPVDPLKYLNMQ